MILLFFLHSILAYPSLLSCEEMREHGWQYPGKIIMDETSVLTSESDGGLSTFFGDSLPPCVEVGLTYTIIASGKRARLVSFFGNVTIDPFLQECRRSAYPSPCKHTEDCDLDNSIDSVGPSHAQLSSSDSIVTFTVNAGGVDVMVMAADGESMVTYSKRQTLHICGENYTTPLPTAMPTKTQHSNLTWKSTISIAFTGNVSLADEDAIEATIVKILEINPFYLDASSWNEYKVYTVDEAEKDFIVSRVNDAYIGGNLTSFLGRNITVSTNVTSMAYTDTSCTKFYSTHVPFRGLGNLTMFVSTERVHIRINGPDRWFGLGFGWFMANSDAVIFDGRDTLFDTILGDEDEGYLDEEIDNLEKVVITTESDGGFTVDFWRDRDTGDVQDKVIPCSDQIEMIWAKGSYRGDKITRFGHSGQNSGSRTVEFSELVSISSRIDENVAIKNKLSRETIQHLHGWIMIIAWLILVPIGVLSMTFRRIFYSPGRPLASYAEEGVFSNKFWFNMHRGLNFSAVILTAAGVYLAATLAGEGHFTHSHGKNGLSILILSIGQVINGALRPDKKKENIRKIWSTVHRVLGVMLFVMAVINMYIADKLPMLISNVISPPEIVIAYAAVVLLSPMIELPFITRAKKHAILLEVEME